MKKAQFNLLSILILLLWVSLNFAQVDIGFKGVGGHLGFVMPEDPIDNTIGFGIQADLGTITPDIHLAAFIDYWSKSYDAAGGWGSSTAEWSFSEIVIGPLAKYYFKMNSQFEPYAGGGLGLAIGKSKWESDDPIYGKQEQSSSDTEICFYFVGGADYKLSPKMVGYAELKYHMDGADYLGIFVGITYQLK